MPAHQNQTKWYEIRFEGHIDRYRIYAFEDLTITHHPNGESSLVGPIPDQSALYAILNRLQDLGIPLVSVNRQERPNKATSPLE
jgi:hypothetical protein